MTAKGPTRAFVLAAGFGTRMLPLSRDLPKPLMPLWGKPMLQRTLELLCSWGVRDAVVNLHHEPGQLLNFLRTHDFGVRVALSFEPDILGTGGALRRAEWFVNDEPFWLINSDVAARLDPRPLLRAFNRPRTLAALWMHPSKGPRTVEVRAGKIASFQSSRPGSEGTFTFCGLHLVSPRILDFLPESGFAGIIEAYERAIKKGWRVAGVTVDKSYWADVGTPQQYLDAHRDLQRPHRKHFVSVDAGVRIARGARIQSSVVWSGAVIGPHAHVENAIVGRDVEITGHVPYLAGRADRLLDRPEQDALLDLRWKPADCVALPLPPRGSARTFTRLLHGHERCVLVRYTPERAENALYARHARFLAGIGVRVPAVLADDPANRIVIVEDLGDADLTAAARNASAPRLIRLYAPVLRQVARFHVKGTPAARRARLQTARPFDAWLYRWEHDFFADWYLRKHLRAPERTVQRILRELEPVSARLLREPRVLIHRDLQSSNVLLTPRGPALIDFQGMRFGAAAYDLASLLCDPYVRLPETARRKLLSDYVALTGFQSVRESFQLATIQRLGQAIGAYVRLSRIPGMTHFKSYIPPALEILRSALKESGVAPALTKLLSDI